MNFNRATECSVSHRANPSELRFIQTKLFLVFLNIGFHNGYDLIKRFRAEHKNSAFTASIFTSISDDSLIY